MIFFVNNLKSVREIKKIVLNSLLLLDNILINKLLTLRGIFMKLTDKTAQIYLNELITVSPIKKEPNKTDGLKDLKKNTNKNSDKVKQYNLDKLLKDRSFTGIVNNETGIKFVKKFENFCKSKLLLDKREKILLGVSAGSDSLSMLQSFFSIKEKYKLKLLAAHVNYKQRGEDSNEDFLHVKKFCEERNILFISNNYTKKSSSEDSFRIFRYDFFEKIAKKNKIETIAVAHNKNDLSETVLLKFLRGAAFKGLSGINPLIKKSKRLKIIHPMLNFTKREINDFLKSQNIPWREDKSNKDTKYLRNYIRLELIPLIKERINPQIDENLIKTSKIFNENDIYWEKLSKTKYKRILIKGSSDEKHLVFKISKLLLEPSILRFYIYKKIFSELTKSTCDIYYGNFLEIENVLESDGSKMVQLPHKILVIKEYGILKFQMEQGVEKTLSKPFIINKPLKIFIYDGYRISMIKKKLLPEDYDSDKNIAYFDMDKLIFPLILRHYFPGDIFSPLGMGKKSKKIKKFFIDEKISKFERKRILIFTDSKKIVWIANYRFAEDCLATKESKSILRVKIEKIEHSRSASRINRG